MDKMTGNNRVLRPAWRATPWLGAVLVAAALCAPLAAAASPLPADLVLGAAKPINFARPVADRKPGRSDGVKRTGLPLPRFASLRAGKVNLRAGPGVRYPVEWVYQRRGLPVMITAEFDVWRKIRDWRGTVGWIHRSMLTGKRAVIVTAREVVLRRQPADDAPAVARAASGVIAEVLSCEGIWCRIEAGGIRGWGRRTQLWGTLKGEKIN